MSENGSEKGILDGLLRALAIFVPAAVALSAVALSIYLVQDGSQRSAVKEVEKRTVSLQEKHIFADIRAVTSDLKMLSHNEVFDRIFLADGSIDPAARAELADDLRVVATVRGLYDQLRFMDLGGQEVVRINVGDRIPREVPIPELQNKQGRYYFSDTVGLGPGQVFVSPLDLNVEGGEVEQPVKPMIRFGTPVFDQRGRKIGIVLLNYLADHMLSGLEDLIPLGHSRFSLLNSDGYYLRGSSSGVEWGFMFEERQAETFQTHHPQVWSEILSRHRGQVETAEGLFTFSTVYPLLDGHQSSDGSGMPLGRSQQTLDRGSYEWKLVSLVPTSALRAKGASQRRAIFGIGVPFLFVLAVVSWRLALAGASRRQAKEELRLQAGELERSNRELDDFAHIVSHDLKESLRGIRSYASFLLEDYGDVLDGEGRSKLEALPRLTARLEKLLDSLLHYSRVGRTELAVAPTDLQRLVEDVVDSIHVSLEEAGVEVRIPEPLPTLVCDPVRTAEIFRNLLTNAMKYNDKEQKWIELGFELVTDPGDGAKGDRGVVLHVRDNGIGIREKHFDSVFGIFRRLHQRDAFGGGTGAGLTIVKKLVERHGGRIWVESTFGEGATFRFTLAASGTAPAEAKDR